jgi:hypothetical protein
MPHSGWRTDQFQWTSAELELPPIGEEEETSMVEEEGEQVWPKPTKGTTLVFSVAK